MSRKLENIAKPTRSPARFVAATARWRRTRRSISGSGDARLDRSQTQRRAQPAADQRRASAASPSPSRSASRDAEQDARRARPTAARRRASRPCVRGTRRRGRHEQVRGERRGQRDQADPEQPGEVEVVDDHARQRQADAAADAEDRAHQPDPAGDALGRERVADDPERRAGRRRRRRPGARARRSRPRSSRRSAQMTEPSAEQQQHRGQHAALAVEVAELADDRRRDRGRQQEAGQHPRRRRPATRRTPRRAPAAPGRPASARARSDTPARSRTAMIRVAWRWGASAGIGFRYPGARADHAPWRVGEDAGRNRPSRPERGWSMTELSVCIAGATGWTGRALVRGVLDAPDLALASRSRARRRGATSARRSAGSRSACRCTRAWARRSRASTC